MMSKWVVDVKGKAGEQCFEISVLLDDNEHGKRSYGWFGMDKLLITHNGGPCRWPLTQAVWNRCLKVAHETAAELNGEATPPEVVMPTDEDRIRARRLWHRQCGLDGSAIPTTKECEAFDLGFKAATLAAVTPSPQRETKP